MKLKTSSWLLLSMGLVLLPALPARALQGGPIMPEYVQFSPADAQEMVNLNTGNFGYNLPLGEVPGPHGGYPLNMSYQAGIGPNQEATWVGLGWTLNPGAINRTLRGVPDDQYHGGELAYLYSYTKSSGWSVSAGYSYGAFSVNMSYDHQGNAGLNAGLGFQIKALGLNAGVSYGYDGLDIGVGMKLADGVGVNFGIGYDRKGDFTAGAGLSVGSQTARGGSVTASIGVHYTSGHGMAGSAGFGYSPKVAEGTKLTSMGDPVISKSSGVKISGNRLSMSAYGAGTSIAVPGSGIGVASSNGNVSSKTSMGIAGLVVPTPIGVFSLGYNRWAQESWLRQATSEYTYGYMYQAGPAVFADAETDDMETAGSSGTGQSGKRMWDWNYKGKSLDRVGSPVTGDLMPGYDLFSVAANGMTGTFRAQALSRHSLFQSVERLNPDDNEDKAQTLFYLLQENATNHKQWDREFPDIPSDADGNEYFTRYAYDYCIDQAERAYYNNSSDNAAKLAEVSAGRCSRYAVLKSRHLNEGNRLVLASDYETRTSLRSRMVFRFMGENGGHYTSESPAAPADAKYAQFRLDPQLFSREVGGVNQGLFGSRRIEPILETGADNLPRNNGRLKGFKITNPDGTQYFFDKPVRTIISADYTTNQAKGAPLFVDKGGTNSMRIFSEIIKNAFLDFVEMSIQMSNPVTFFLEITSWDWERIGRGAWDLATSWVWDSPKFRTPCEMQPDEQYNFSYTMKVNPYATQWLLTEIRGPEFVLLDRDDMSRNIGYQVKFNYAEPYWYKWRFPFAPPMTPHDELPNIRLPRNAVTPEECNSDLYHGSFGVKEMVYLQSIETATHKAEFTLNDPVNEPRQDGKGWIQDWNGTRQGDPAVNPVIPTAMPLYVNANLVMSAQPVAGRGWGRKCETHIVRDNRNVEHRVGETCWWERDLAYTIDRAYLNMMPTKEQEDRIRGRNLVINGLIEGSSEQELFSSGIFNPYNSAWPAGFVYTGFGNYTLKEQNGDLPAVYHIAPAKGLDLRYGSTVMSLSPVAMPIPEPDGSEATIKYKNVYRYGINSCTDNSGIICSVDLVDEPDDDVIPATLVIGDNDGTFQFPKVQPLLVFNDFVETEGDNDNQMRFLKSILVKDKVNDLALRKYEFKYDYNIQPGTLNSYPLGVNPDGSPDFVSGFPDKTSPALAGLGGKLKLNAVQEFACVSSDCVEKVSLPPFRFFYKNEGESSLKIGETFLGSIVASSTPQDEWGFWNKHSTAENKKVRQDFATFGAVSWSMDKVVDPAGGTIEIEYERDTYRGETYGDDYNSFPVSWKQCEAADGYDNTRLCIDILPRRWKVYCNRDDQLEGEWDYQTGVVTDADYAYMNDLFDPATNELRNPNQEIYFQLDANSRFLVGCGAKLWRWRSSSCSRHRSVGMVGNGIVRSVRPHTNVVVPFISEDEGEATAPEVRTLELDVPYKLVHETLVKASEDLTGHEARSIYRLKGMIWIKNVRNNIKGGDIRVTKLVRRDIGLVQTTKYDYGVGEMATYPDSVLSTAFAERFSPTKAIGIMPTTFLPGISRVPGIGDEDLAYLPGSSISYPKVTVTNITQDGTEILNGKMEYEFIGPESGVPQREGGFNPFLKVNLLVHFGVGNTPATGTEASLRFQREDGTPLGSLVNMIRVPNSQRWEFEWNGSDGFENDYKDIRKVEVTLRRSGVFAAQGTASLPNGIVLGNYSNVQLTSYHSDYASNLLNVGVADVKTGKSTPILVRSSMKSDPAGTFVDYTSFLGKPTSTYTYRWMPANDADRNLVASQDLTKYKLIRQDTIIYSSLAPSGDDRFYSLGEERRTAIGQDEEKWEYMRRIRCYDAALMNGNPEGLPACDFGNKNSHWFAYKGIDITVDGDKNYVPKQMSYSRRPAFMVETINKTGFNGSTGPEDFLVTRTTNHRFDPVTGMPTLSVTYSGPATISQTPAEFPAKAVRSTPAYSVNTPLASVMYERNMLSQIFREDAYTWTESTRGPDGQFINFDFADLNDADLLPPRLTGVKITPFTQNFLDFTGRVGTPRPITAKDNPILGSGSFTPRFKLTDEAGRAILADNAALFTAAHDFAFLENWKGGRIVGLTEFLQPRQTVDIYGISAATHHDPSGFHQIGGFANAGYDETAVLTAAGMATRLNDISTPGAWRFTNGSPVLDRRFIRLTGDFSLSYGMEVDGGKTYLVEGQFHSSVPRSCQVTFYTESGPSVPPTALALPAGLSAHSLSLVVPGDYDRDMPPGHNRIRLACNDGVAGTVKVAYLRAYPEQAQAATYIHDVKGKMVQSVNEQNVSTYYEYDAFGNLAAMRNDDGVLYSTHKRELTNVAAP